MNKKILKTVKVILWGLVYTLPLWQLLIATRVDTSITLYTIMNQYITPKNFVAETINKVFSVVDIHFVETQSGIVQYMAYFVFLSFIHICIDLILFLPDCARYIFDNMVGSKDEDSI